MAQLLVVKLHANCYRHIEMPPRQILLMVHAMAAIGFVIAIVGLIWLSRTCWFVTHAAKATGTVIRLDQSTDWESGTAYYPVFSFKDARGLTITHRSGIGSGYFKFSPGQEVSVLYAPENPENALIATFRTVWMPALITTGFGILFGGFAALWLALVWRAKSLYA